MTVAAPGTEAREGGDAKRLRAQHDGPVGVAEAPARTRLQALSTSSKRGAKTRRYREAILHINVAEFLTLALGRDVFWTTFPAGGGGAVRGAMLKASGLKAGVPDVLVIYAGRAYWLELKASNGRVSHDQIIAHANLIAAHSPVAVCRSVDGVAEALRRWDIPLRARVAA